MHKMKAAEVKPGDVIRLFGRGFEVEHVRQRADAVTLELSRWGVLEVRATHEVDVFEEAE